jgi:hypothetical protein
MHAKLSVEFWRDRGFENLVRARAVKAAKRAERIRAEAESHRQETMTREVEAMLAQLRR